MVNWGVSLTCIPVQGNMRRGLGSLWQTQSEWRVQRKYLNRPLSNFGDLFFSAPASSPAPLFLLFFSPNQLLLKVDHFNTLPFPSYKMCPFTIIQVDKSQVSRAALCFCCLIKLVSSLTLGWSGNVSSSCQMSQGSKVSVIVLFNDNKKVMRMIEDGRVWYSIWWPS